MTDGDHDPRVPTVEGNYWCRAPHGGPIGGAALGHWRVDYLYAGDDGPPFAIIGGSAFEGEAALARCEWGPRIPSPARLAAMEELANIPPFDGDGECLHCDGAWVPTADGELVYHGQGSGRTRGRSYFVHEACCPWQRAQEPVTPDTTSPAGMPPRDAQTP